MVEILLFLYGLVVCLITITIGSEVAWYLTGGYKTMPGDQIFVSNLLTCCCAVLGSCIIIMICEEIVKLTKAEREVRVMPTEGRPLKRYPACTRLNLFPKC